MKSLLTTLTASLLLAGTVAAHAGEPLWVNIAQLYGSDTDSNDSFGEVVSIDGDTLVVAAFRKTPGAVYIFERLPDVPTRWQETKRLTTTFPGDMNFGILVSVSEDTLVVSTSAGEETPGSTYVYERDAGGAGAWGMVARFVPSAPIVDHDSMAMGDGSVDVDEQMDAGGVHMFERDLVDPYAWHYLATLTASDARAQDRFGVSLGLSGDRLLAGADQVRDLGSDGGAAYIFERNQVGTWREVVKLLASDGGQSDRFGSAVGLDAETAIVGNDAEQNRDTAYIFERDSAGAWSEVIALKPSELDNGQAFASEVAISGDVVVAGAWNHDLPNCRSVGAAYIFERNHGGLDAWGQVAKIIAPDPQRLDQFGLEVDLDHNTLVVGVRSDDDKGSGAGTVYLFSRTAPLLSVTGSCPGRAEVTVIGTTPVGQVVLLGAQSEGSTSIPGGPCEGTEVNLDRPRVLFAGTATSGGDLTVDPIVGPGTCGRYLQAIDIGTCMTSDVSQVP